eukprot:scaffold4362_cov390-Prasinococcus_capsulatus_cf.AAC.7
MPEGSCEIVAARIATEERPVRWIPGDLLCGKARRAQVQSPGTLGSRHTDSPVSTLRVIATERERQPLRRSPNRLEPTAHRPAR